MSSLSVLEPAVEEVDSTAVAAEKEEEEEEGGLAVVGGRGTTINHKSPF